MLTLVVAAALLTSAPFDADQPFPGDLASAAPWGDISVVAGWLGEHPNAPASERRGALSALCEAHARAGRYREAYQACEAAGQLFETVPPGHRQATEFWRALSDLPPITVEGSADLPLSTGWSGLAEVRVESGGESALWAVDTGAEVTTLSETDARRFGVRLLADDLGIGGSTEGVAQGRLGVLVSLKIGAAVVRDVPVFVLPDAVLTVPEHGRLPPILGMPVLYGFQRVAFVEGGRRLRLGDLPAARTGVPLRWGNSGFYIEIGIGEGSLQVHVDSGANQTELLREAAEAVLPQPVLATGKPRSVTAKGVSGVRQATVLEIPSLAVRLGERTCVIPSALLGTDGDGVQGRVGMDLAAACRTFMLDFRAMTASAEDVPF